MSLRVCATFALAFTPVVASAQWYPTPANQVSSQALCGQPVVQSAQCGCVQPVVQYRSVAVTEYQPIKQTVRRPVVETNYVEQPVTEYRPVTETRTAEVATVSYQNVTECRTVQRDAGRWVTQYRENPRVSPCQYDGRPNLMGWLARTGYSIRSTFTPRYAAQRQYVPQVYTQTVPVTRQVAIRGTRQVAYNVTKMVPYETTRKVAVNTVRYVDEEVTTMRPVTVMRTVPTGSSLAYVPLSATAARTAMQPTPDRISAAKTDGDAEEAPSRTAEGEDKFGRGLDRSLDRSPDRTDRKERETSPFESGSLDSFRTNRAARRIPAPIVPQPRGLQTVQTQYSLPPSGSEQLARTSRSLPSVVRVNGWVARGTSPQRKISPAFGPTLVSPVLAVVDAH